MHLLCLSPPLIGHIFASLLFALFSLSRSHKWNTKRTLVSDTIEVVNETPQLACLHKEEVQVFSSLLFVQCRSSLYLVVWYGAEHANEEGVEVHVLIRDLFTSTTWKRENERKNADSSAPALSLFSSLLFFSLLFSSLPYPC
jgi:hypothetical protein